MLIDIHCHANLYLTLDEVIKEAREAGVNKIISVGMSAISLERILEISEQYSSIYPALGIHPEEVMMNDKIDQQIDSIITLIKNNGDTICAIGEIGLDHHFIKEKSVYPLQDEIFKKMLSLAQELNLPVNLHTKGAEKEIFDVLPSYDLPDINIHWYSGPEQFLRQGIDRGYYFSITPAIKYSPAVQSVATSVDESHLLLESDGPVKYSGVTGSPAMVRDVLMAVSKLRKIDHQILEDQIEKNTKAIFKKLF